MKKKVVFATIISLFFCFSFYMWGSIMNSDRSQTDDKFILLDFDGVIADSWEISFDILNSFSDEYGFKPMSSDAASKLTTKEILKEYEIGFLSQLSLVRKIKSSLVGKIDDIPLFKEFTEVCRLFSERENVHVAIVTSNSHENVSHFLDRYEIKFIKHIHSNSSIFGKHKAIKSFLKEKGIKAENALYVGDEVRDIEGAKKAGVSSLSVSWGYDPLEKLQKSLPNFIATTPEQAGEAIEIFLSRSSL